MDLYIHGKSMMGIWKFYVNGQIDGVFDEPKQYWIFKIRIKR